LSLLLFVLKTGVDHTPNPRRNATPQLPVCPCLFKT
jgi:hypothetical protein